MKVIATTLAGLALGATGVIGAADAATTTGQSSVPIQIRHETAGCHSLVGQRKPVPRGAGRQARARGAQADHHR